MNKLKIKIPWWYKPFIFFMPNFYKDIPEYKHGESYNIRIDIKTTSFFHPVRIGELLGTYNDTHTAYLKVRWKALWKDFWTKGSNTGIEWVIYKYKIK